MGIQGNLFHDTSKAIDFDKPRDTKKWEEILERVGNWADEVNGIEEERKRWSKEFYRNVPIPEVDKES
jgi:hypothetical protein